MLGLDGKEQIEEYGIEPFIKHYENLYAKYKGMWEDFSSLLVFWADMDNPYATYDNAIESEWWASQKQIWDKGLLYKGFIDCSLLSSLWYTSFFTHEGCSRL